MGSPTTPPPRSLSQEGQTALDAQLGLAPQTLRAESQYRPAYAAVDLAALDTLLMGDPNYGRYESSIESLTAPQIAERYGTSIGYTPGASQKSYEQALAQRQISEDGWRPVAGENRYVRTVTNRVAAPQRGLLDLYANEIAPAAGRAQSQLNRQQRSGDIADVQMLAGQARTAFDSLNPEAAALYNNVARMDAQQLAAGAQLDPFQQRAIEQGYRSAISSRGLNLGSGDAAGEALAAFAGGEQMRQLRRGNALQSATALQGFYGDPFQQILGRSGGSAQGLLNSSQAQTAQGGAKLFDPFNAYASDVFNTNYNADASARIASANNTTALIGGAMSMIGGLGRAV